MKKSVSFFLVSLIILVTVFSCQQSVGSSNTSNVKVEVNSTVSGGIGGGTSSSLSDEVTIELLDVASFNYVDNVQGSYIQGADGTSYKDGDVVNDWIEPNPSNVGLTAVLRLDRQNPVSQYAATSKDGSISVSTTEDKRIKIAFEGTAKVISQDAITITIPSSVIKSIDGKDNPKSDIVIKNKSLKYNIKYAMPTASISTVEGNDLIISGYTSRPISTRFKVVLQNATFRTNDIRNVSSYVYPRVPGLNYYGSSMNKNTEFVISVEGTPESLDHANEAISILNLPVRDAKGANTTVSIAASDDSLKYNISSYTPVVANFVAVDNEDLVVQGYTGTTVNKEFKVVLTNGKFERVYNNQSLQSYFTGLSGLQYKGTTNADRTELVVTVSGKTAYTSTDAIQLKNIPVKDSLEKSATVSINSATSTLRYNITKYNAPSVKITPIDEENDLNIVGYTSNAFNKTFKLVLQNGEFNQYNNSTLNEYFTKVNGFSFRGTTNSAKNEITVSVSGTPANVSKGKIAVIDLPVKDITGVTKNVNVSLSTSMLSYDVKSYKSVVVSFAPISGNNLIVAGFTTYDINKPFKVTLTNATFRDNYKDTDISTYFSPTNGLTFRGTSNSNNNEITVTVSGTPTTAIANNIALTNIPVVDVAGVEKTASINSSASTLKYNIVAYSSPSVAVNKISDDLTITGYTQTQIDKTLKFNVMLKNAKFATSYSGSSVANFFTPTNGLRFVGSTSSDRTSMTVTVSGTAEAASNSGIALVNLPIKDDANRDQTIGLEEERTGLKYNIVGYRPSLTSFTPVDGDDLTIVGYTKVNVNKQFKISLSDGTFNKDYSSENISNYFNPTNGLTFIGSTNPSRTEMTVTVSGTPTKANTSTIGLSRFPIVDITNKNTTITISSDESTLSYNIKDYPEPDAAFDTMNPGESLSLTGFTTVPLTVKFRVILTNATFDKVYNDEDITKYFKPLNTGLKFTGKTTVDNTEMEVTATGTPSLIKSDIMVLSDLPIKDIVGQDRKISMATGRSELKYSVKAYQSFSASISPVSGGDLKISGFTTKAVSKKFRIVLTNATFDKYYENDDITQYFSPANNLTFVGTSNGDRSEMEVTASGTPISAIQNSVITLNALPILDIANQSKNISVTESTSGLRINIEAYKDFSGVFAPLPGDDLIVSSFVNKQINKSFKIVLTNGKFKDTYNNTDITNYFSPHYNFKFTGTTNPSGTEMTVNITGTPTTEYVGKIALYNDMPVKDMNNEDKVLNISEVDSTLRYNVKNYKSPSASFVSLPYDDLVVAGYTTVPLEKTFKLILSNATFRTDYNSSDLDSSYFTSLSGLKFYGTTNAQKTEMTIKVSGTPTSSSTTAIALINLPVYDELGESKTVSLNGSNNSLKYSVKAYIDPVATFTSQTSDDLIISGYTGKAVNKKFNITLTNGKFKNSYNDTDITSLFTPSNGLKFYGTTDSSKTSMAVSVSGMPSALSTDAISMSDVEVLDMADQIKTVSIQRSSSSLRFDIKEYLPTSIQFGAVSGDNLTISGFTTIALTKTFKVTLTNATFRRSYSNENIDSLFSPRNGLTFVGTTNKELTEMTVNVSGTPTSQNTSAIAMVNVLVTNTSGINETVSIPMVSSALLFNIKTYQAFSASIASVSGSDLTISGYKSLDIDKKTFKIVLKNATFEYDAYNTDISEYFSPSLDLSYIGTTNGERTEMTVTVSGKPNNSSTGKIALQNYPILDMAGQNKTVSISGANSPLKYSVNNYEPYSVSINAVSGDDLVIKGLTENSLTKTFKIVLANATFKNTYRNADITSFFTPSLGGLTFTGSTNSAKTEITVNVSGIPSAPSTSSIAVNNLTILDMAGREQAVDIIESASLLQYSVLQYYKPVFRYWAINEKGEADTDMTISGFTTLEVKKEIMLEVDYATFNDYRNEDLSSYFAPSNGLTFRGTRVDGVGEYNSRVRVTITGTPLEASNSQIVLRALPIINMVDKVETISSPSSGTSFKYDVKKYIAPELSFVPLDGEELVINGYHKHSIDKTFKIVISNGVFGKDYNDEDIKSYFNLAPIDSLLGTTNSERTVMTVKAHTEELAYVGNGGNVELIGFPVIDIAGRNITSSINYNDSPFVIYYNDYSYPSATFTSLKGDDLVIDGIVRRDTVNHEFKIIISDGTVDLKDTDISSYLSPNIGLIFKATLNAEKNELSVKVSGTPDRFSSEEIALNELPVIDALGDAITVSIAPSLYGLRYNVTEPEKPNYTVNVTSGGMGIFGFTTKELKSTTFTIKHRNNFKFDEYYDEDVSEHFIPSNGLIFKATTSNDRKTITVNVSGIPSAISSEDIYFNFPLTGPDNVREDYAYNSFPYFRYNIRDFSEYKAPSFKINTDFSYNEGVSEITDYTYEGWTDHELKSNKMFVIKLDDGYFEDFYDLSVIDDKFTHAGSIENFFMGDSNAYKTELRVSTANSGNITKAGSSGIGFSFNVYDFLGNKTTITLNEETSPLKVNFKKYYEPSITMGPYDPQAEFKVIDTVYWDWSQDPPEMQSVPMKIKIENATFKDDELTVANFKTQRHTTGDLQYNFFEELRLQEMSEDRKSISLTGRVALMIEQAAGFVELVNVNVIDMAGDTKSLTITSSLYYRFDYDIISMSLKPFDGDNDLKIWLEAGKEVNKKFIIDIKDGTFQSDSVWVYGSTMYNRLKGDVSTYFTNRNGLKFTVSEDNKNYSANYLSHNSVIISVSGKPTTYDEEFKVGLYRVETQNPIYGIYPELSIIEEDSGIVIKEYEEPIIYGPYKDKVSGSPNVYPTINLNKGKNASVNFFFEIANGTLDKDLLKGSMPSFTDKNGKTIYDMTKSFMFLNEKGIPVEPSEFMQHGLNVYYKESQNNYVNAKYDVVVLTLEGTPTEEVTFSISYIQMPVTNMKGYSDIMEIKKEGEWKIVVEPASPSDEPASMTLNKLDNDNDLIIWLDEGEEASKKFKIDLERGTFQSDSVWVYGSTMYNRLKGDVSTYFTNRNGLKFTVSEDNKNYSANTSSRTSVIISVSGEPTRFNEGEEFKVGLNGVQVVDSHNNSTVLSILEEDSGLVIRVYTGLTTYIEGPYKDKVSGSPDVYPSMMLTKGKKASVNFIFEIYDGTIDIDSLNKNCSVDYDENGKKIYDLTEQFIILDENSHEDKLTNYGLRICYRESLNNYKSDECEIAVLTLEGTPTKEARFYINTAYFFVKGLRGEKIYLMYVMDYWEIYVNA